MIELLLPYPPSTNGLWRHTGRRSYKTPQYIEWELLAEQALREQPQGGTMRGMVCLGLRAAPPDKRRRDLDNIIKPILDFLVNQKLLADDSLVQSIEAWWSKEVSNGVFVVVAEMPKEINNA